MALPNRSRSVLLSMVPLGEPLPFRKVGGGYRGGIHQIRLNSIHNESELSLKKGPYSSNQRLFVISHELQFLTPKM